MKTRLVMRRCAGLAFVMIVAICGAPALGEAQQPPMPRVGWLAGGSPPAFQHITQAFLDGMREQGYIEGRDFVLDLRAAEGRFERLPQLAADLVATKAAVILVGATAPLKAARDATSTIPIVMASVGDPVGTGFIASLERPGGNITGLMSSGAPRTKYLELITELVPRLSRLAVVGNPRDGAAALGLKEWPASASAAGIDAHLFEVDSPDKLEGTFAAITRVRADALIVLGDALMFSSRARIVELAAKNRIPAMYPQQEYVQAGGLMSYGSDLRDLFQRSAGYVVKVLKGANPAQMPVEPPRKFELAINIAAARALDLTIPESLRAKADRLVE